jgi:hypothetical protein
LKAENTTANWMAMDNLFLKYAGTEDEYFSLASASQPVPVPLANPRMDAVDGWTATVTPALGSNCAEYYQKTFSLSQTLSHAPVGKYVLKAQAFQRPGTAANVFTAYTGGTDNVNTYLFLGDASVTVNNIMTYKQSASRYSNDSQLADGSYVPNSMAGAAQYFNAGLYDNELEVITTAQGNLTLGLRSDSYQSAYWTIFDNFRLYYYGEVKENGYDAALRKAKAAAAKEANGFGAASSAISQYEWTSAQYASKSETEIAKAIAAMPKWTPGMHEGQAVRVKCTLYVEINLNNKKVNVSLTQPAPRWGFGFGPF